MQNNTVIEGLEIFSYFPDMRDAVPNIKIQ